MQTSMRLALANVIFTVLSTSLAAQAQEVITTCGQTVTSREAVLGNDLDCSAPGSGDGIAFEGKYLDLGGFTIEGQVGGFLDRVIFCENACVVSNGTVIAGSRGVFGKTKLTLDNVNIEGAGYGAYANRTIKIFGGSITNSLDDGVYGGAAVKVEATTISNSGRNGINAPKVSLNTVTITGSGNNGVGAHKVKASTSEIAGNCLDPLVPGECADVRSCGRPKAYMSICDTSLHYCDGTASGSWDICTLD